MSVPDVSIVIPIYNEQDNIRLLYRAVADVLGTMEHQSEIVFVDDGSTDRSLFQLEALARDDARVKVVELRRNFGQTAAMSAGIDEAAGAVIVTMDGDMQNDPADIPRMLATLQQGYDLVHGWRKDRKDALWSRKVPSKIANWLISRTTGFPVHDLGCTLKAIRSEHAKDLRMYGEMHRFIPILAHWQGARCQEIVTNHFPRRFGQTKYGIWRTVRVLLDLMTVKYMIEYSSSPMKLFGGFGLAAIAGAVLSGLGCVAMKLLGGVDMTGNPLLLLTVLASTVAMQFVMLGLLGEVATRTYHESQNRKPYRIRRIVAHQDNATDLPAFRDAA